MKTKWVSAVIESNGVTVYVKSIGLRHIDIVKVCNACVDGGSDSWTLIASIFRSFSGSFALILTWDQSVVAATDPLGAYPIYFKSSCGQVSVTENFRHLARECRLMPNALEEIVFSGFTIGRKTIAEDVEQLGSGDLLVAKQGMIQKIGCYINFIHRFEHVTTTESTFQELLEGTFLNLIEDLDQRPIVVPLSAGYDSRLIVSGLKHFGHKNVTCISYGTRGSFECSASAAVAEKLGYPWVRIEYTRRFVSQTLGEKSFERYLAEFDTGSSLLHFQEFPAFAELYKGKLIDPDSVIINGSTGDFLAGGHIPEVLKTITTPHPEALQEVLLSYVEKHFSLWGFSKAGIDYDYVKSELILLIESRLGLQAAHEYAPYQLYETLEHVTRQAKLISSMQRVYEFFDYEWRLPLWDRTWLNFWASRRLIEKCNKSLYIDTLLSNNWGGVWDSIPVNTHTVRPIQLMLFRRAIKLITIFLGSAKWREIDSRFFEYWLDPLFAVDKSYIKSVLMGGGVRNRLSWMSKQYEQKNQCGMIE